jgi:glycosyltransferase involved in cell wall biosynthesis
MKILMVNSFYYIRGGAERCFFDLTKLLENHGHHVIPFCMRNPKNKFNPESEFWASYIDFPSLMSRKTSITNVIKAVGRVIYSREAKNAIKKVITRHRPDIAHIHGIAHELSPSILDGLSSMRIPTIFTLHDYKIKCPNTNFISQDKVCEKCYGGKFYNVARYRCKRNNIFASILAGVEAYTHNLLKIYEKNVNCFISPSKFLKNKMHNHGFRTKTVHIPNFINMDRFKPSEKEKKKYCVYLGRIEKIKGVLTLAKAINLTDKVNLIVAGRGEAEPLMRIELSQKKSNKIEFLGHIDTNEIIQLVQEAQFSIIPSEWYENNPMSALESMACGTPVIGANIGGIPEIVQDGVNGLLFEPGDYRQLSKKIEVLRDRPDLCRRMGENGRRMVLQVNNPETHYEKTFDLYKSIS